MDDASYEQELDEVGAKPRRPGLPVEPRRVLRILAPHRRRLARALLTAAVVSFVASFFVPDTYESTAVLLYEGSPLPGAKKQDATTRAFASSATVPSRLREVRDRLGWDVTDEELGERVRVAEEGQASLRMMATASNAEDAQRLAQTLLDVFLAHQTSFNSKEIARLAAENELSLKRARERRDAAQQAFDEFRQRSGKPDLLDEKAQLLQRGAELRSRADEASVEIAAQRALIQELEQAQEELPKQIIASARRSSAIEGPLAEARSELATARATLSEEHPRVQALKQRVARLQAQKSGHPVELGEQTLAANPARTSVDQQLAGARAALAAAQERYAALQVLLADLRREADALAPEEGEARQVVRALDGAILRIEKLTAREAELRDASLGPLTGFRVLSTPVLPEASSRSATHALVLLLFPILVVLAYAMLLLLRSLRTLTVEAPREVAWWGNGPVLGTSVWPRVPDALDDFVDELEDQGVYGAGRTLVVPATEVEREIACDFAMRLADAPWLAAAILDVGERARDQSSVVPQAPDGQTSMTGPRRLSSQGTPSVAQGRAVPRKPTVQGFVPPTSASSSPSPVVTPPPESNTGGSWSSRPPRKRTVIGLPAVDPSTPIPIDPEPPRESSPPSSAPPRSGPASAGPQPFRRKRNARATVRMIVPVREDGAAAKASTAKAPSADEEAFLLTRPVPVATDETPSPVGRAVHVSTETPQASATNAVMRAAIRLLGNEEDDVTQLRRSEPPAPRAAGDVTGVALAWNGPLAGPVLRRAARLAHRVIVVVSSGLSVVDLARVQTRLGRDKGVGYVLVNVEDAYVDTQDRVGPVEEFWHGDRDSEARGPRLP